MIGAMLPLSIRLRGMVLNKTQGHIYLCKYIYQSYKTIIMPVVLCGCETWSLTFKEEHRVRVFENRVLRRTIGPERNEETGGLRKLHYEELHNLYSSPSISRMMKSMSVR
jgi:hypothetical protein